MRKISYSEAIAEAQLQEMQRDEKVFLMGLVLRDPYGSAFGQTKGISTKLGTERVIDVPVSENGYVGAGVGAAITGMRPVVELQFSDFITICMDQVVQQAANVRYMFGGQIKVPMVLRAPTGAYLSAAGQHSHSLESWFSFIPGIKVVLPSDAYDAKGLLTAAIRDDNFVLYLEHKKLYDKKMEVPEEPYTIPIGKAAVKREGKDLTIVAWSFMVSKALDAAAALENKGISVEVVDLRSVSPLDEETILSSVEKTGKLLVLQETYRHCSVATDVSALVAEKGFDLLDAPIRLITAKDVPIPFAPVLENFVLPQTENVVAEAERLLADARGG
ncbi:MAG: alpha-ketoacid dehydrogenase subunit beta [Spirochaetia bacterium]